MQAPNLLVVDASVAVKWHLSDEDGSDEALLLLRRHVTREVDLVAPEHIRYEVPNAITFATIGQPARLTRQQGRDAIEEFLALGIATYSDSTLLAEGYELAHRYGCAFYDGVYVALSERLRCPMITADARLYQRVHVHMEAIWLNEYR
jgi:predicted nucleic acid-binding protein